MSLQLAIPWRVALQPSPPPLRQPIVSLRKRSRFEKNKSFNGGCSHAKVSHRRGPPQEAVARIETAHKNDNAKREEEIAVWLHSKESGDWERALVAVNQFRLTSRYLLTIAYRFWSSGNIARAIEVGEEGISIETARGKEADAVLISKFKNSLAYYYADGKRADKREVALEYSRSAREARPEDPAPLDTRGYVLITFGESQKDVKEGIEKCYKAYEKGTGIDSLSKHLKRASERLVTFAG